MKPEMEKVIDGATSLMAAMVWVDDEEERNDLLERLTAITYQMSAIFGVPCARSYEEAVSQQKKMLNELRGLKRRVEGI